MKYFLLVAASLASVDARCFYGNTCGELTHCPVVIRHLDNPPINCNFPQISVACCDTIQVAEYCQRWPQLESCISSHTRSWPTAERNFMRQHQNVNYACPVSTWPEADIHRNVQQYCHLTGEEDLDAVKDSMHELMMQAELAIMTAQQPELPAELKSSLMPGMLGCAFGAAVVTAVVAMKKKRTSTDYLLCDETA